MGAMLCKFMNFVLNKYNILGLKESYDFAFLQGFILNDGFLVPCVVYV